MKTMITYISLLLIFVACAKEGGISPTPLSSGNSASSSTGIGGSYARFAIRGNTMYIVDTENLHVWNLSNPLSPIKEASLNLSQGGVETIFIHENYLLMGSNNGMIIYDISTPGLPTYLSTYTHVFACDPVVADGNYAYVTLRAGRACGTSNANRLEVINIADPTSPYLVRSSVMDHPYGLGIDPTANTLFVCDGSSGCKVYDITSRTNLNQVSTITGVDAWDVIPFRKNLILVGQDGLYQYDYSNPANPIKLSKILIAP